VASKGYKSRTLTRKNQDKRIRKKRDRLPLYKEKNSSNKNSYNGVLRIILSTWSFPLKKRKSAASSLTKPE